MARMLNSRLSKIFAQVAAMALVVGGLAVFVFTQANGTGTAEAQPTDGSAQNAEALDIELASAVAPLASTQVDLPKAVTAQRGDATEQFVSTATTVEEALEQGGVTVGADDIVEPALDSALTDGAKITVKVVEKSEVTETRTVEHDSTKEDDSSLEKGKTKVKTEGKDGEEEVTFEVTTVDGEETEREEISATVTTEPVTEVVSVGTKEPEPEPTSSSSSSSDSSSSSSDSSESSSASQASAPTSGVWQRLAQCESGGNWSINTGNGYYGGLQFNPNTWAAMGGTQYAPLPHQATPAEQIAVATKLQAAAGWGQWPHCSSQLGLR